jgi:hypothetical protein
MGRHDPDSRSDGLPESQPRAEAAGGGEPRPAAVGSLMSVQIRRNRAPRKPAPGGPAPGETAETPGKRTVDPATLAPATRTAGNGEPQRGGEITAYWTRLRGNRPCPAVSDLDPELIAADWPNSILFQCRAGSGALMPDMSFLPRPDGGSDGLDLKAEDGKIQLSPMMLQWLVSLAEDAVRNQRPVEELESFPSARRAIGYRAVALPLSDDHSEIDHVLCHVKYA